MRKSILMALLLIVLTGIPGCSGGSQTCTVTGLTPGGLYEYGYQDSDGNVITGQFRPSGSTYDITGVDSSIDCGNIGVIRGTVELMAEYPAV